MSPYTYSFSLIVLLLVLVIISVDVNTACYDGGRAVEWRALVNGSHPQPLGDEHGMLARLLNHLDQLLVTGQRCYAQLFPQLVPGKLTASRSAKE